MRLFLKRLIYGRRYSKPSDRLFQDHILEHHSEFMNENYASIYQEKISATYGVPSQLQLTFKDAKSKEEAQHKLESAHDLKLGGVWLPKGSVTQEAAIQAYVTHPLTCKPRQRVDLIMEQHEQRLRELDTTPADGLFGFAIMVGMVISGSLLLAAVLQWALTL